MIRILLTTTLLACCMLACNAPAAERPAKPPVYAAYYIWYTNGQHPKKPWQFWTYPDVKKVHGDDNPLAKPGDPPLASSAYPLAGLYASDDPTIAAWHMQLARAAGIDAFLVDWWGPNHATDATFEKAILPTAERLKFKIALLDELAQFHGDDGKYQRSLAAALKKFIPSPSYLRIDGKPAVYLYQTSINPTLTPASFAHIKEYVERETGPIYWIVDKIAHDGRTREPDRMKCIPPEWLQTAGIDAFAFYGTFSNFRAHAYEDLAGKYRYIAASAHAAGKKMILPVHPGHNNSRYRADYYEMPRRDGQTFRDFLRSAEDAGTDAVLVTSWNEWPETTVIEPSSTWPDPYQYLKILAEWKGMKFDPPALPWAGK